MINQEINIKLNKGGYYFPLEVLTNEDAIKLNKNYHKIKTIHAKKNLLLEHKLITKKKICFLIRKIIKKTFFIEFIISYFQTFS